MTEITERTQLLITHVGEQGPALEARDFKKLVQVISEYVSAEKATYNQFLLDLLSSAIRRIPLKQHIYAGLLSELHRVNPSLAMQIFKQVVTNLEKDLNTLKFHEAINGVFFLSELMNMEKLNSQCFLDAVEDIVGAIENTKNANHRGFLVGVFVRTLGNYCYAMSKKVYEFKKLLERAKKFCGKNPEFTTIYECQQKGTLADSSLKGRLWSESNPAPPSPAEQLQQSIRLKIEPQESLKFMAIEYHLPAAEEGDKLYQEYQRSEGYVHLTNMEQIIQLMKLNSKYLVTKVSTYLRTESDKNSFMQRYCIDLLIGKALKAKNTVVETYLLVKLIAESRVYATLVESALLYALDKDSRTYDLGCQIKYAEIVSYIVQNWPTGAQDMTDIGLWDWDKFVGPDPQGAPEEEDKKDKDKEKEEVRRTVLLKLICAKLLLLNDSYRVPSCLKKYAPAEQLKNPTKYKAIQQMQTLQSFQSQLKSKAPAEQVLPLVASEGSYQIFLEALFERTSQSHTHLEVLLTRYQKVFMKNKQEYDWSLLNVIRSYWAKSLFHRLLYLETVIERGFVDFESYVKYIAKVETSGDEEAHLLKLELNQLNQIFGKSLDL